MAFAEEGSPAFFAGAFDVVQSTYLDEPKVAEAFRTGKGVGWHEHSKCLFSGTERFFRPGYNANLVSNWIPTLEGVEAKLKAGAKVADVGCGHGASTIVMAQAYPKSRFFGFDYHKPSIDRAKVLAQEAGVGDRIEFAQASAKDFPAKDYDLVAFFDCLHDMGDPVGARQACQGNTGQRRVVDDRRAICSMTISRIISTRSGPFSITPRHSFVHPRRSLRRWAWGSVPRQVKANCVRSRLRQDSSASAARLRHPSI